MFYRYSMSLEHHHLLLRQFYHQKHNFYLGKIHQDIFQYSDEYRHKSDILLLVSVPMFDYLSATEYNSILQLEKITHNKIILRSQKDFSQGQYEIKIK